MRQLFRLLANSAVVASLVLAGALSSARVLGKIQPVAVPHIWFATPDGAPCPRVCVLGVMPGETSFAGAIYLLENHPVLKGARRFESGNENVSRFTARSVEVLIGRLPGTPGLAWITLAVQFDADMPPPQLIEVLYRFGTPDWAAAQPSSILTDLFFDRYNLQVSVIRSALPESPPLAPTSPIYSVYLRTPEEYGNVRLNLSGRLQFWQGMTRVDRYYAPRARFVTP